MYLAVLYQAGEGCDYTIACGTKVIQLDAQTWDDAVAEAQQTIIGEYRDDRTLSRMRIVEVTRHFEAPVRAWYADLDRAELEEQNAQQKEQRRKAYERLKHEFGA